MNSVNTVPYHRGNLREALIRTTIELVDEGVSDIRLREVARRVGVSPSATYRHFGSQADLFEAVRATVLSSLGVAIDEQLTRSGGSATPAARLMAAGRGYVRFALTQPGQFRLLSEWMPLGEDWQSGADPLGMLVQLVREAAQAQGLHEPAEKPFDAAVALWSSVHGFAMLCTAGSLRLRPDSEKQRLLDTVLATAVHGIGVS